MTRIVDHCPASDDELPDVSSLARKAVLDKPTSSKILIAPSQLKSPGKTLVPKSPSKSVRRIRKLDSDHAASNNPLFQKWNSDAEDISRPLGSPSKRSPRKSRLTSCEPSVLSTEASIFDSDAKPRLPRLNPMRLSRPARVTESADELEDSLGSLTTFSLKPPSLLFGNTSAHPAERADHSSSTQEEREEETRPGHGYDQDGIASAPSETDLADSEYDVDPAQQLLMEATMYADRSGNASYSTSDETSKDSSFNENSCESVPELNVPKTSRSSPARLLFGPTHVTGDEFTSSPKQTDSVLQPKHANVLSRRPQLDNSVATKNKTPALLPPSPAKWISPNKQRLRMASQATAADLADSLKELRLQIDEDSKDESDRPRTPSRKIKKSTNLLSPGKLARIPKGHHRPSVDAFWSQEFVDEWNDQHSPRKLNMPPSPRKSPVKASPSKELKRLFEAKKHTLAEEFLLDLDGELTDGKIAELAEATGGVKLVWTKTLNTTAGRANWKRETIRTKHADGTEISVQYKHHASIELAEKVIDEEHRLLNVLAHEFCHLATFMVDGVKDSPHGKEFKAWAAKCSRVFEGRGVQVTTKHTYDIDFKYVWECVSCATAYKRHSRSIDPKRHRCGSCKGELRQMRPVPRQAKGKQPSDYQVFVKEQMKVVREEHPGSNQKAVMKVVAERWTKRKAELAAVASATSVSSISPTSTMLSSLAPPSSGEADTDVAAQPTAPKTLVGGGSTADANIILSGLGADNTTAEIGIVVNQLDGLAI